MFLALLAWHSVSFNEKHISREGRGREKKGREKKGREQIRQISKTGRRDDTSDKHWAASVGRGKDIEYVACVSSSLFLGGTLSP